MDILEILLGLPGALEGIWRGSVKVGEWLEDLRTESPKWLWVVIGVCCWTVLVATATWCLSFLFVVGIGGDGIRTTGDWIVAAFLGLIFALPIVAVFAGIPWLVLALAMAARRLSPARRELADLAREREELPASAPKPVRFTDFSPMPDDFSDFARMLEGAKEKNGTLICFECGHHNPVGQTQCQECGAWVPQTAKARGAYRPRTDEA